MATVCREWSVLRGVSVCWWILMACSRRYISARLRADASAVRWRPFGRVFFVSSRTSIGHCTLGGSAGYSRVHAEVGPARAVGDREWMTKQVTKSESIRERDRQMPAVQVLIRPHVGIVAWLCGCLKSFTIVFFFFTFPVQNICRSDETPPSSTT